MTNAKAKTAAAETPKKSFLETFFTDQLQDVYNAEQQLLKGLDEMIAASTSEELEDAFTEHRRQTERHISRLEKVFRSIGQAAKGKKCEAMEGLLKEARTIIKETKEGSATRDAALIIAAQKIEHYEIATYGGLAQLAMTMDLHQAADLLERTLQEEEQTDKDLTEIAERFINVRAEKEGPYSWQKQEEEAAM